MLGLELKQLEAYVKVYEMRSFSQAADELFLSQPSVSAYINSLEKELQTQLIYRSTKEFLPTKAGELFYEYAKDMLALRTKALASIRSLSGGTSGSVDVLASSVPAQYILPEILGAFHRLYPLITFNVGQADTADVVKGIVAHKAEVGVVGAKIDNAKCVYEHFLSEKLALIAPCEPRFEQAGPVDLACLLREEYFVAREPGSGTRIEYEAYMKKLGIKLSELKVSACLNNTQSVIHAVAGGLGLAFVSEPAAAHFIRQKQVVALDAESLPERSFYFVFKKNCTLAPAAESFVKFAREQFATHQ